MRFGRLVAELAGGGVAILAALSCGDDSSPAITDPDASATEVMGSTSSPAQTTTATDGPTPTTSDAPTDGGPDSSIGQMTTDETSTTVDTLDPTSTTGTVRSAFASPP